MRARGGGTLEFADIGRPWVVDGSLLISSSDTHIRLQGDIVLKTTQPSSVFIFSGEARGRPIRNVSIAGVGKLRQIDGAGRSVKAYSYKTSDTFYSCVLFKWCDDWSAYQIEGANGLVNCLRAFQCGPGHFLKCGGRGSVYDNGISIDFDRLVSSPERKFISECYAIGCSAFGITVYAVSKVQINDCIVTSCGNDDTDMPVSGGGVSVEGDFKTIEAALFNRNVQIANLKISDCYNAGIFVNTRSVHAVGLHISKTRKSLNRSNKMKEKGSGVYCFGAGFIEMKSSFIEDCAGNGITIIDNSDLFPEVKFQGAILRSGAASIFLTRGSKLTIEEQSKIDGKIIRDHFSSRVLMFGFAAKQSIDAEW